MKETNIHFSIEQVQSRSKNSETFDAADGLKSLIKMAQVLLEKSEIKKVSILAEKNLMEEVPKVNQQDQNFLLWDEVNQKKEKKKKKIIMT